MKKGDSIKFGQPDTTKVIPEVFVGDVERSPEAKEIIRLVSEHAVVAAEHGSRAVALYSESLVGGVREVTRDALARAVAVEKRVNKTNKSPSCMSWCFGWMSGGKEDPLAAVE